MSIFGTIFGSRTTKAPSGSLSVQALEIAAFGFAANLRALHGSDVTVASVANTNSMLPTFDANAVLLLEAVPFSALSEGDIVTWRSKVQAPGKLIVHRLNERRGNGWWTLGDGNGGMDNELVTAENFDRRVCGILYGAKDATTDQ